MKKLLLILSIFIVIGVFIKEEKEDIVIIPDNSLRFRVIANSNSLEDYKIKTNVKEKIEQEITDLLENTNSLEDTKSKIKENLPLIEEKIRAILDPLNKKFEINFGKNYFPKKIFKGVVYPDGNYESLVITIGEGKGDNWWCVLFPPLCLLEDNESASDVEYQFFISRIIKRFK